MQPDEQKIWLDVYQRLGGIEAKIDDVRQIRQTANEADAKADKALLLSEQNADEIGAMKSEATIQKRWLVGTVVGGVFSSASLIIAMLSFFIK